MTDADATRRSRLRERLGSVDPFALALLGAVGFLGDLFPRLAILQLFHLFWLFALWPFAAMVVGAVKRSLGRDDSEPGPRDWLVMDDGWRALAGAFLGLLLSVVNPLMGRQDVMQLLGSVVAVARYRGALPGPETTAQSATYRLPVDGTWTVVNGSPIREHSHSWFPATQRYAYDLVITDDEGRTRPAGTDTSVENYYCHGRPVLAPADGVVVDVHDGDPELGWAGGFSHPLKRSVTGNRVTIRHADGEYTSLVHLVPGSVAVEPGDAVARGERVGRCGHSGNSSEPHLHVQVQDHPAFELAAGLPVRFDDVTVDAPGVDVTAATDWDEPEGGTGRYVHVGQRVTHDPDGTAETDDAPTAGPRLRGVRSLAAVGNGIAVGGFGTVLAGFLGVSVAALAPGLAALAALALAYHAARSAAGARARIEPVATAAGAGAAAVLLGGVARWDALPSVGPIALGAGAFAVGFLLYGAAWERGRRRLRRDA